MKKIVFAALIAMFATSCGREKEQQITLLTVSNDSLQVVLAARDSVLNEALFALSDISSTLSDIKRQESIVVSKSELGKSDEAQVKEDLEILAERLSDQRKAIATLKKNTALLKKANINIAGLEKLMNELRTQIDERDATIKAMLGNIDDLNNQIIKLNTELSDANKTSQMLSNVVSDQESELNKAYVAVGPTKELLDRGILIKKGLGNKTLAVNPNLDKSQMTIIDIRETSVIDLSGKNAEIIGSFPVGSYTFVSGQTRNSITKLRITDADTFWENSRVLVITFKE
ncbi:MAG: hypothetical protein K2N21_00345 [Rikenellaceae bacterium]|nr:hypothetical protein [Rikenellaceae bacterium]